VARATPAEKQQAETVFVDDGYPEADEFANNYRERITRVERTLPMSAVERQRGVVAVLRSLFGWNHGAANSAR
jgi:hypothetical protein